MEEEIKEKVWRENEKGEKEQWKKKMCKKKGKGRQIEKRGDM